MDLQIPNTPEAFVAAMEALGVQLPLLPTSNIGCLVDASGRDLLTIDVNDHRQDEEVELLSAFICAALNNYAGFETSLEIETGKAGVA